jgi:hypothetical protein
MNKLIFLLLIPIIGISQNNGSKQMTLNQESEEKQKLRTEKYAPKTNTVIIRDIDPRFDSRFDQGYGINSFMFRNYSNPRYSNPYYYNTPTLTPTTFKGSIGLSKSVRLIGLFFTVGEDKFLIGDLMFRPNLDNSEFYSNINIQNAIQWNDERLNDIEKGYRIYVGYGQRIGFVSPFISAGIGSRVVNYQFIDDLAILNGSKSYSFPKFGKSFVGIKVGGLFDFKKFVVKFDMDPINPDFSIGVGFRITK